MSDKTEWQKIETAPKDGSVILLCNTAGPFIGNYHAVFASGYRPDNPWSSLMLNHWYLPEDGRYDPPTHWMPLPEPPK